jgi:hypothetical protein
MDRIFQERGKQKRVYHGRPFPKVASTRVRPIPPVRTEYLLMAGVIGLIVQQDNVTTHPRWKKYASEIDRGNKLSFVFLLLHFDSRAEEQQTN